MKIENLKLKMKNNLMLSLTLFLLILFGTFLRFYDLNWGAPYYFHPDERNIASSISQLNAPSQLNPNFFAYGSLPIYIIYFTGVAQNYLISITGADNFKVTFDQAIIIGRMYSALFSVLTLLVLYNTARLFISQRLSVFCVALGSLNVGLIQYAHFGTFETYLTFFSLALVYTLVKYSQTNSFIYFLYSALIIGILTAIKISSLILLPLPILLLVSKLIFKKTETNKKRVLRSVRELITKSLCLIAIVFVIFLLTNPFVILDFNAFYGSMKYESSVATGELPVFYTGTFYGTIPILYQSLYVMPFLLNPVVWIIFIPLFTIFLTRCLSRKQQEYRILLFVFLFLFIPQTILYVKWTRYLVPTLPIIFLIISISLSLMMRRLQFSQRLLTGTVLLFLLTSSIVWSFAFVKTVYYSEDTRVSAAITMEKSRSNDEKVISEVYDLGIVPFDRAFSDITLLNFYELENDSALKETVFSQMSDSDIFILPSQRIIKSRLLNPNTFPEGNHFYQTVLSSPQYSRIYQTPCDVWCMLLYLGDPINGVEDTANVFDRPTVTIFSIQNYEN